MRNISKEEEIYIKLKKDFPSESYSKDSSRGFDLTSLKAQYIIERLNDVLGVTGWNIKGEWQELNNGGVLYNGVLTVNIAENIHTVEAIGYSPRKKLVGDAYKGARTDAISKACSYIGIGNEVYKGNVDPRFIKENKSSGSGGGRRSNSLNVKNESLRAPSKFTDMQINILKNFSDAIGKDECNKALSILGVKKEPRNFDKIVEVLKNTVAELTRRADKIEQEKKKPKAADASFNLNEPLGAKESDFDPDSIPF